MCSHPTIITVWFLPSYILSDCSLNLGFIHTLFLISSWNDCWTDKKQEGKEWYLEQELQQSIGKCMIGPNLVWKSYFKILIINECWAGWFFIWKCSGPTPDYFTHSLKLDFIRNYFLLYMLWTGSYLTVFIFFSCHNQPMCCI